jgi:hypothetical protein
VYALSAVPSLAGADEAVVPESAASIAAAPPGGARVTGKVTASTGTAIQLELRDGSSVTIDLIAAQEKHLIGRIIVGEFLVVQGSLSGGLMTAVAAYRASSWGIYNTNANLVPTVANGKVYVASYKELTIWGRSK